MHFIDKFDREILTDSISLYLESIERGNFDELLHSNIIFPWPKIVLLGNRESVLHKVI